MLAFFKLFYTAFISLFSAFLNPLFGVVIFLVYMQYKKINKMEIKILGEAKRSIKKKLIRSLITGLLCSSIGIVIIMFLGITIMPKDFIFILPLAVILMLINIRYLCFSYAGGVVAISSYLFGVPTINISSVLVLIGILHLIESMLIWLDGSTDPLPLFIENKEYGIVGGFSLQRFWPIPIVILLLTLGQMEGAKEIVLPDWWPIFRGTNSNIENMSLQMVILVAALGYGDMAITNTPEETCKKSAKRLFVYSIILIILSVISTKIDIFKFIAAVFAPLAHEGLILYGQREEKLGKPLFTKKSMGVTVLDIKENKPGHIMGLNRGDVILKINNYYIYSQKEIQLVLTQIPSYIWIEIMDLKGAKKTLEYTNYQIGIKSLGILIISDESQVVFDISREYSLIKKWIKKRKNKK
ncbi:PDZ domain-containing protein [Lutibacter sp. B2]|nr:PDZ domain-containing protein [Lutibacter sp. B2]